MSVATHVPQESAPHPQPEPIDPGIPTSRAASGRGDDVRAWHRNLQFSFSSGVYGPEPLPQVTRRRGPLLRFHSGILRAGAKQAHTRRMADRKPDTDLPRHRHRSDHSDRCAFHGRCASRGLARERLGSSGAVFPMVAALHASDLHGGDPNSRIEQPWQVSGPILLADPAQHRNDWRDCARRVCVEAGTPGTRVHLVRWCAGGRLPAASTPGIAGSGKRMETRGRHQPHPSPSRSENPLPDRYSRGRRDPTQHPDLAYPRL